MTIVRTDDGWVVQAPDLRVIAGPFATNREAWCALEVFDRAPERKVLASLYSLSNKEASYAA